MKRFEDLKREVIDRGFCVHCGACTSFCNRLRLNWKPVLIEKCIETCASPYGSDGVCYEHCPMVKVLEAKHIFQRSKDDLLGNYKSLKAARALHKDVLKGSQDGGVATMILKAAFEKGKIDAAIVVGRDADWRSQPRLIKSANELAGSGGSKYTEAPIIELLGRASREGVSSIAVVGIPCHIQALRNLEYGLLYPNGFSPYSDMKIYVIGLFCSGSFYYDELMKKLDVEPTSVKKMDVKEGDFRVEGGVNKKVPLKDVKSAIMPSCHLCRDYTSKLADISLGSIGTPAGWTTVIERNPKGFGLLKDAIDQRLIEVNDNVDEEALRKTVSKRLASVEKRIKGRKNAELSPVLT